MHERICVLGAGVIGLSTALHIQRALPKIQVTILADKFGVDTTSDGAAGIFRPTWEALPGVPDHVLRRWTRDSWEHFDTLAQSAEARDAGVSVISGYQFRNDPPREPELTDGIVYQTRPCTERDFAMFPDGRSYKYGCFMTTLMVEGRWYIPYLTQLFRQAGGKLLQRHVDNLEQLVADYDVVVNATGLGSRRLLGDHNIRAVRGQMIRARAPWIKHFVFSGDRNSWIIPGIETVVIGGTRQSDNYNTDFDQADQTGIMERACKMIPSLKDAEIAWTWVGLRPFREPTRVEKELMRFPNGRSLKVIHNYGHGSVGMAVSWGAAAHATQLVLNSLTHAKL